MNYPIELVKKVEMNLISKKLKPSDVTIYYDMDNTLALFSIHGLEKEALVEMVNPGFYESLMVLDDGIKVVPVLQAIGFKVKILSACINTDYCRVEKVRWIKRNLPTINEKDIILCNAGENKSDYIEDITTSILVDDYGVNLIQWMEKGGVAIKKSYSGKKRNIKTIQNHVEIFTRLFDLGLLNNPHNIVSEK